MDIVVLDGGTTNPGDLSWAPLEALGRVTVYDSTPADCVVKRARDAEALIVNRIVLNRAVLDALPKLRYIGTRHEAIASTAPAAPSMCPVIDFVELTTTFSTWPSNAFLIATVSLRSLSGVLVPCALMYSAPWGSPASCMARRSACAPPTACGCGAVM